MTQTEQRADPWSLGHLAAVPCALCGYPVAHFDPRQVGVKAGGACQRVSCRTDPKSGRDRQVYTFSVVRAPPA